MAAKRGWSRLAAAVARVGNAAVASGTARTAQGSANTAIASPKRTTVPSGPPFASRSRTASATCWAATVTAAPAASRPPSDHTVDPPPTRIDARRPESARSAVPGAAAALGQGSTGTASAPRRRRWCRRRGPPTRPGAPSPGPARPHRPPRTLRTPRSRSGWTGSARARWRRTGGARAGSRSARRPRRRAAAAIANARRRVAPRFRSVSPATSATSGRAATTTRIATAPSTTTVQVSRVETRRPTRARSPAATAGASSGTTTVARAPPARRSKSRLGMVLAVWNRSPKSVLPTAPAKTSVRAKPAIRARMVNPTSRATVAATRFRADTRAGTRDVVGARSPSGPAAEPVQRA